MAMAEEVVETVRAEEVVETVRAEKVMAMAMAMAMAMEKVVVMAMANVDVKPIRLYQEGFPQVFLSFEVLSSDQLQIPRTKLRLRCVFLYEFCHLRNEERQERQV
jgi:hypothetical protein